MNRNEYLRELERRLRGIPKEDREDALRYYSELIDDMGRGPNEDVVQDLGPVKNAAKSILDECGEKYASQVHESGRGTGKAIWLLALGLLSAPVTIPVAIVLIVCVLSIYLVIAVISFSMLAAGIGVFAGLIFIPGVSSKFLALGAGLVFIGLGILVGMGFVALLKLIVRVLGNRRK